MARTFEWDAAAYNDAATIQHAWGVALMDLRRWRGDERVLDAGCGGGGVTEELLRRIPRGTLVAVDVDPDMVASAKRRLAAFGARARVLQGDLVHLPPLEPVDVIFSNAVFHWVPDHDKLFLELFRHLVPGGELLAQAGGEGNLHRVREISEEIRKTPPFDAHFQGWAAPWNYQDDATSEERLLISGFVEPEVSLRTAPVTFPDDASLRKFAAAVLLRPYFGRLEGESLRAEFLDRFITKLGRTDSPRTADYVRLTIRAKRPPHPS